MIDGYSPSCLSSGTLYVKGAYRFRQEGGEGKHCLNITKYWTRNVFHAVQLSNLGTKKLFSVCLLPKDKTVCLDKDVSQILIN